MGDRGREQELERRLDRLLAVSVALAGARSREDVARVAIDEGRVAGAFWLLEPERATLRRLAGSGPPHGDAIPVDGDGPLPHAVRTATPLFLTAAELAVQFPASFARDALELGYACLPLVCGDAVLGALAISCDAELQAAERTVLAILARQCALALERVRLLDAERAASLSREEILSVVTHDLRNPLGTILMGASTLLQLADPADPKGARTRTIGERINRQAERMARQIEDLVDFGGIEAGRLAIERKAHAPAALVERVAALLAPLAQERGLVFEVEAPRELPLVDCDDTRVSQTLWNLAGNAFKVTPKGGRITIGVALAGDTVVFSVRDTGPGLDPDEVAILFQRYWRSKQATYKGAGLGLSIARGIVDAHGGKIWAQSERGKGCSFFFTLVPA